MDAEDLFPRKEGNPLTALAREDLDPLSVEELKARIAALETEVERVKAKIQHSVNHRESAEGLFKR